MPAEEARVTVQIRKAVFPAAGLGSRFLPATKAQPKEMLPLVDKPIIQYGVEEALASGAAQIIVVAGKYQHVIEAHFTPNKPLEDFLESQGKTDLLAELRAVPCPATFTSVLEATPLGLGHAVLAAREAVGDEPFIVILSDDVIDAQPPATRQLINVYNDLQSPVLAVERLPADQLSQYGVIDAEQIRDGVYKIRDLIEKPKSGEAPSDLAIIGRYVLTPNIFSILDTTQPDTKGEIQLTDALRELLRTQPIYACEINGVRHDTGNKPGFLRATTYFAQRQSDLGRPF